MTRRLRAFGAFWYGFIVGDDWRVALGVIVALALTATMSHLTTVPTWWIVVVAVGVLLVSSLRRAIQLAISDRAPRK